MLRRVLPAANAIFLGHIIVRLGSAILVPLFLKYWSALLYGEYLALFAAVSYLTSLDFGMQQATINRLTQLYVREELDEYRSVYHTTLTLYIGLATIVTLLAAGLTWLLPISRWIGLKLTSQSTASSVILLLTVYVMWSMPVRLIGGTYQTTGNLARSQWIWNLQQIFVVGLSALVLILGGGMLTIAVVQVIVVAAITVFLLIDLYRRLPALFPGIVHARFSAVRELTHPSLLFGLLIVGNLIAYQGSTLIVAGFMGGLAVAVLSIARAIIDLIRQVLYSIAVALCPDFARMEALEEFEALRKVHRLLVASTGAITLALAASVWFEGPEIIAIWTHGHIEPDAMLLRLFLILLVFQTPWAASSTVATATNRHRAQAIGYFSAAVIGIAMVVAFIGRLGTWAVPVGLMLGEAVCCYHFVIKASCLMIRESYPAFALRFWLGFVAVGAGTLSVAWGIHNLMPGPILVRWTVMGLTTLSTAAICGWVAWLTPEDRAVLARKWRTPLSVASASPKTA
jgi:O-antigen/teichoic acid export membrane protein